jgi:hypothetical protein
LATATSIEIKRAQEAERLANELSAVNSKLDRVIELLTPRDLPATELITSVQFATKQDVESIKTAIFDDLLSAINAPTSIKPVAAKPGRPSSQG